jgi:glutathione-regulated potassium-efflux system ancillary protein KefC/glutathione-regulated potassium-efflux system protein KefB
MSLQEAVAYLAAAVFAVVLARKLGFGSVLGYLLAGVLIGPWGLRFVTDTQQILHFAEIGVVFLLFIIGLELHPSRLWLLRRAVFGIGVLQVLVTGSVLALVAFWLLADWAAALLIGFGLALSSTAFVLQMLAEKKELKSVHGRAAFGVLLFQDLAVIPLIAVVPLLAATQISAIDSMALDQIVKTFLVVAGFIIGGHYLLRPLLGWVASAQIQEIFTAAALLLVIGAALIMEWLGLSMGLGAFLAGMLVADSPYRHQLETDIKPFKGLLLGLFFMAVGMSAKLGLLVQQPGLILALTAGLMALKAVIIYPLARAFKMPNRSAITLSAILAQGGEFAFVLFIIGVTQGLLTAALADQLILAVTLSMGLLYHEKDRPFDTMDDTTDHVIIAGFGRFGQIVARILAMHNIPFTALEVNPAQIDFVRRYGAKVYYGDPARLDLLQSARAHCAKVFVLAVDDVEDSVKIATTVKRHFPDLDLIARARNRQHAFWLMDIGAKVIIRDTFLSSIHAAKEVLIDLGLAPEEAREATELFRKHDEETLGQQHAIHTDEDALIQSQQESNEQLRRLFESDART